MQLISAVLTVFALALAMMTSSGASPKDDCSKYQGLEKEACEKMAGKKR